MTINHTGMDRYRDCFEWKIVADGDEEHLNKTSESQIKMRKFVKILCCCHCAAKPWLRKCSSIWNAEYESRKHCFCRWFPLNFHIYIFFFRTNESTSPTNLTETLNYYNAQLSISEEEMFVQVSARCVRHIHRIRFY